VARVWNDATVEERRQIIRDTHFRIDESHHICTDEGGNTVGGMVRFAFENEDNTRITMSTATDYRGDGQYILAPDMQLHFKKFKRQWLDNFYTLGIHSLTINFTEFKNNP